MIYKGIALTDDMMSYLQTYHILDRDNITQYLDNDVVFQKMINKHLLEVKIYKALFNFGVYGFFYSVVILIKG